MIGFFRLALALIVVWAHLVSQNRQWAGNAVFMFYLLSGYFATLSMQNSYQGRPLAFLASRALRILPTYWLVLVSTTTWIVLGDVGQYFSATINYPSTLEVLALELNPRAIPVAWVLPVFWFWWAAIAFGAASTQLRSTAFLALGVAAWLIVGAVPGGHGWGLWAGGLPFSLGSIFYWLGVKLPRDKGCLAVWAGAISFPTFLLHYSLAGAISTAFDMPPGWKLFAIATLITLVLSWLMVVAVEKPMERYRQSLRTNP